jgi:hypothetical protein
MGLSRRQFSREFKLAALQRLERGSSVGEVAHRVICRSVLHAPVGVMDQSWLGLSLLQCHAEGRKGHYELRLGATNQKCFPTLGLPVVPPLQG